MHIKFDISNKKLEWRKKSSLFTKWAMQNNSDALAATHIKLKKMKIIQLELILIHSLR